MFRFKTLNEVELEKLNELFDITGEIRRPKRLTAFESYVFLCEFEKEIVLYLSEYEVY